jgi:hypothetical protein
VVTSKLTSHEIIYATMERQQPHGGGINKPELPPPKLEQGILSPIDREPGRLARKVQDQLTFDALSEAADFAVRRWVDADIPHMIARSDYVSLAEYLLAKSDLLVKPPRAILDPELAERWDRKLRSTVRIIIENWRKRGLI